MPIFILVLAVCKLSTANVLSCNYSTDTSIIFYKSEDCKARLKSSGNKDYKCVKLNAVIKEEK